MAEYDRAFRKAIEESSREVHYNAFAIDPHGTKRHDDFLSFRLRDNKTFARAVLIADLPSIFPYLGDTGLEAKRKYFRNIRRDIEKCSVDIADRIFPIEIIDKFQAGQDVPVIAFEKYFDIGTGENVGFEIFKATASIKRVFTYQEIDLLYGTPNNFLVQPLSLDPEMNVLLSRTSRNGFGQEITNMAITSANRDAGIWCSQRVIDLIGYDTSASDLKTYFVNGGEQVKMTRPLRQYISYLNLVNTISYIDGVESPVPIDFLNDVVSLENQRSIASHSVISKKPRQECTIEAIHRFEASLHKGDVETCRKMLKEISGLGVSALTFIANNSAGREVPLWETCRIRDTKISGKQGIYTQVCLVRQKDGKSQEIKSPIEHCDNPIRSVAANKAAEKFWNAFLKDLQFNKCFWFKQQDLVDYKTEHELASKDRYFQTRIILNAHLLDPSAFQGKTGRR